MRRIFAIFLCMCFLVFPVQGSQETKYVALTFDDGPSGRFTRRLLEGLEAREAKATFLLCGYRLKDYPALAEQIWESGHEIGLHGYSHKDMGKMTAAQVASEIKDTLALLPKGCRPVFLRPPGGSYSTEVMKAAEKAGLALLNWSVDPRDWATKDAVAVQAAVVDAVQDGDVILLHDMSDSSVDAALGIIDQLQKQGFRFVTVSELVKIRGVAPKPGQMYCSFR